jgi:hypothetical protein
VNNPLNSYVVNANHIWKDFVDLRKLVNINLIDYEDARLKYINNTSDTEVKVSESNYKVVWEFNLLEIFSTFAN